MTAPDPGLTDLIATHTFESGGGGDGYHEPFSFGAYCSCGEEYGSWVQVAGDDGLDYPDIDLLANLHAAHVALVVEQQTNGRHEWPKTTPAGHTYERPTTYDELNGITADMAQGEIEGWEKTELPPEPTWSMVTLAQREIYRQSVRIAELEATIARVQNALEVAEESVPDDWGVTYIYTSRLRAALEGEQQ